MLNTPRPEDVSLDQLNFWWPRRLSPAQHELWQTLQSLGVEAAWEPQGDAVPFLFVVKYRGGIVTQGEAAGQHPIAVVRATLLRAATLLQRRGIEVIPQ